MYVCTIKVCGCFDGLPLVQTPSTAEKHKKFSGVTVAKTTSISSTITTPGNHSNGSFTHIPIGWLNVRVHGDWLFCSSFRFELISFKEETNSLVFYFFHPITPLSLGMSLFECARRHVFNITVSLLLRLACRCRQMMMLHKYFKSFFHSYSTPPLRLEGKQTSIEEFP